MKNSFLNGAIVAKGPYYEEAIYHVSNNKVSAVFNGKGALTYYAHAGGKNQLNNGSFCIHINDIANDVCLEKTVTMLGRKQSIIVNVGLGNLIIEQFLDINSGGVFFIYKLETNDNNLVVDFGLFLNKLETMFLYWEGDCKTIKENLVFIAKLTKNNNVAKLFVSFEKEECDKFAANPYFDKAYNECIEEIKSVKIPKNLSEEEKALFYSSYFCVLENYKEKDEFKGFTAGYRYMIPLRTYYRDGYYTVLPMYNGHTDKVRNQIITLAKGIFPDGSCPSAVNCEFEGYWGDHFDSPSFFAIALFDYVNFTKDFSILDEDIKGVSLLDKAEFVMKKLSEREHENGLLYKDGPLNRRDWCDEVNRYGYVTYDEILYSRAFYCLSKLFEIKGDLEKVDFYYKKHIKSKNAINNELWDENKGYYINFKNEDYVEDNLSVDTVFAAIFGIADDQRAKTMLKSMEKLLECKNNPDVLIKDFGVMSVWPFYKKVEAVYWKSAQPYNYHNGSNWPYLAAMYAYAKRKYNMEYKNALESWFFYNLDKNNYTPIEYFSSACADGSLLQAWSGTAAFILDSEISLDFFG